MSFLVLDTTAQIARMSNHRALTEQVESAVQRALEQEPGLRLRTTGSVYREFLRKLVTDFLAVRDLVATEFHGRGIRLITMDDVAARIESSQHFTAAAKRRARFVMETLRNRFGDDEQRTRPVIRFLDSEARDFRERRFFQLTLDGEEVEFGRGEDLVDAAACLARFALSSREDEGSKCLCKIVGRGGGTSLCLKASRHSEVRKDPCLDRSEYPMRCCSPDPDESCELPKLLASESAKPLLARLRAHAEEQKFSPAFAESRRALIQQLHQLREQTLPFLGLSCAQNFTEVLTILECGEGARIVSYDPDFDELGRAIGAPELRVDPTAGS